MMMSSSDIKPRLRGRFYSNGPQCKWNWRGSAWRKFGGHFLLMQSGPNFSRDAAAAFTVLGRDFASFPMCMMLSLREQISQKWASNVDLRQTQKLASDLSQQS